MTNLFLKSFAIIALMLASCTSKKEDHNHAEIATDTETEEWKEMDEFHLVMAESFHPYKDSSNLAPAKVKAGAMADAAENWANAPLPHKVDNDEVRAKLDSLVNDANDFEETVKSGNDESIAESLTNLHDLFHQLQGLWYSNDHEHEHTHDH